MSEAKAPNASNIHFIGIGGVGMSGLAKVLKAKGYQVSGTDLSCSLLTESLVRAGVKVSLGHSALNIPASTSLVVHTAAVGQMNPEIVEAGRRGIRVARYSEVLGALMSEKIGIAVSGTHGKTTTTSMIAHILRKGGFDPSYVIGGSSSLLQGNSAFGFGAHFVVEACEYAESFLDLKSEIAVINNIEADHLDYYKTFTNMRRSFEKFASMLPGNGRLVANAEDMDVMSVVVNAARCQVSTFGIHVAASFKPSSMTEKRGRFEFDLRREGTYLGRVKLLVPGYHNVKNALAAAAACFSAGASGVDITKGLSTFTGVERRFQVVGRARGVKVINDYSHHPTEIRALLSTARRTYPESRVVCAFQPHQGSRTRFMLEDFARAFALADKAFVSEIYFVRDTAEERNLVSSRNLVARMRDLGIDASFLPDSNAIAAAVASFARSGDVVLVVGAGPLGDDPSRILEALESTGQTLAKRSGSPLPALPSHARRPRTTAEAMFCGGLS